MSIKPSPIKTRTVTMTKKTKEHLSPVNIIASMRSEMQNTGRFTAQPVHTPLDPSVVNAKDLYEYLSRNAMRVIETWPTDYVYADEKYKGVRVILLGDKSSNQLQLYSKSGKSNVYEKFRDRYFDYLLKDLPDGPIILDGEMLLNKPLPQGDITGFIRNPKKELKVKPVFRVFDILYYNGIDLRDLPLETRRKILELVIDNKGAIKLVKYYKIKKGDVKALERAFRKSVKKNEGLVIKDPTQPYMQVKGEGLRWLKIKYFETPDLELKRVEAHPRDKPFRFYKHWVLVPSDAEDHEISADKGFDGLGFDWDFYINFTKDVLDKVDKGELVASRELVDVDPEFIPIYGRDKVPKSVTFPNKENRLIVELLVDDISKNLIPTGQKILGIRYDKREGDKLDKLKLIRELLIFKKRSEENVKKK